MAILSCCSAIWFFAAELSSRPPTIRIGWLKRKRSNFPQQIHWDFPKIQWLRGSDLELGLFRNSNIFPMKWGASDLELPRVSQPLPKVSCQLFLKPVQWRIHFQIHLGKFGKTNINVSMKYHAIEMNYIINTRFEHIDVLIHEAAIHERILLIDLGQFWSPPFRDIQKEGGRIDVPNTQTADANPTREASADVAPFHINKTTFFCMSGKEQDDSPLISSFICYFF